MIGVGDRHQLALAAWDFSQRPEIDPPLRACGGPQLVARVAVAAAVERHVHHAVADTQVRHLFAHGDNGSDEFVARPHSAEVAEVSPVEVKIGPADRGLLDFDDCGPLIEEGGVGEVADRDLAFALEYDRLHYSLGPSSLRAVRSGIANSLVISAP